MTSIERWDAVVVIGTKGPFPRLLDAVAAWARAGGAARRVWVQHGEGALPAGLDGATLVPRDALLARMRAADVVIVHAGTGAIRDALSLGHVPVVVPRRAAQGEHVNDHQREIAQALSDRVIACDSPENAATFESAIARARERSADRATHPVTLPGDALRESVGARLAALTARPARRTALVWRALAWLTRDMTPRRR